MKRAALALLLSTTLLWISGCDDSSPSAPQASTTQELLDQLFAAPTEAETTLVASQWAERTVQVAGATVESTFTMPITLPEAFISFGMPVAWAQPASATLRVVSHEVDGFRHYGALLVPEAGGSHPVLVFAHGDDAGIDNTQLSILLQSLGTLRDSIAIVIPSFRSEPVDISSIPYYKLSEGAPSPWDRDIEDLRALLRVCAYLDRKLDTSKVAIAGYSRGGGVALLAAERDPVFKSVATVAAPTSFQGSWVRGLAESLLAGQTSNLPGVDYIDSTVLQALKAGRIGMDSARRELIRRSASTWARRLPAAIQCHHGRADITVLPGELERLKTAMESSGKPLDAQFWDGRDHMTVLFAALPVVQEFARAQLLR